MKFQVQKQCRKCGIIILNSSLKVKNRAFCKYCFKTVVSEIWQLKKDKANARARIKAREERKFYTKNCLICKSEFVTTQPRKLNCKDECIREYKNNKKKKLQNEK